MMKIRVLTFTLLFGSVAANAQNSLPAAVAPTAATEIARAKAVEHPLRTAAVHPEPGCPVDGSQRRSVRQIYISTPAAGG